MKLSKKMYELSEKMKALSNEARVFTDNGETDKALDKMKEFDELKAEFAIEEKLYNAENFFNDDGKTKTIPGTSAQKDDTQKSAFFTALRNNFQGYGLTKGLMTEGTNASAGYLVPVDTQTSVNEYKSERFSFADYVNKENVKTNKGSRVYRNKNTSAAFTQVALHTSLLTMLNTALRISAAVSMTCLSNSLFQGVAENARKNSRYNGPLYRFTSKRLSESLDG